MSTYDADVHTTGKSRLGETSPRAQIAWGGGGFLLGVIVWHFIGFWSFVSTVVFRGPDPGSQTSETAAPTARTSPAPDKRSQTVLGTAPAQAFFTAPPHECTALVLDRASGATSLAQCADGNQPLRVVQSSRRGDRHISGEARDADWSAVVDADVDTAIAKTRIDATLDPRLDHRSVLID